ncbi:heat-inducible transcription repressor HrcA [Candidatus Acetothermia bacterium]|nr:MAG: heat-inducible transcription repressor HrcA [Candidatus Acetothermia bacterium]HHK66829.1 heat-inducible transcription repressor HrcA [Candidatus Acetothermia bacterium]
MKERPLPDRQRLILKEIVDRYIRLREPVSSRMILEDYGLSVSSATVRNDMNDLEASGYIEKPYSSSGRIPTKKGYRFFVDWLLDLSELTREERLEIVEAYETRCLDVSETIHQTAFLLENITGYAAFVIPPRLEETRLERVVLLKMAECLAFLVIISEIGVVEHGLVPLEEELSEEEIRGIMETINRSLRGANLEDVRMLATGEGPEGWYERPVRQAFLVLGHLLERRKERRVYIEGLLNLAADLQEMIPDKAMERFTRLGRALRDGATFAEAVDAARKGKDGIVVNVGDLPLPGFEEFSVVSCGYRPHSGFLGVIAPLWMDYGRAMSATSYIANRLETILLRSCVRSE